MVGSWKMIFFFLSGFDLFSGVNSLLVSGRVAVWLEREIQLCLAEFWWVFQPKHPHGIPKNITLEVRNVGPTWDFWVWITVNFTIIFQMFSQILEGDKCLPLCYHYDTTILVLLYLGLDWIGFLTNLKYHGLLQPAYPYNFKATDCQKTHHAACLNCSFLPLNAPAPLLRIFVAAKSFKKNNSQGIVGCTPTNVPLWEIPI